MRKRLPAKMTEIASKKNSDGKTVLIVEDEVLLRELESTILQEKGYHVLEAESGRKALKFRSQKFNLHECKDESPKYGITDIGWR